jgi:hypothetical protein
VADEGVAGRDGSLAHGRLPVGLQRRQLDLAEDEVDHAVEDLVLVGDVVVQRHRLHAEGLGELAHGEGGDARLVGELDGGTQDPLLAQRHPEAPTPRRPSRIWRPRPEGTT